MCGHSDDDSNYIPDESDSPPKPTQKSRSSSTSSYSRQRRLSSNHRDVGSLPQQRTFVIQTYRDHAHDPPLNTRTSSHTGLASDDEPNHRNKAARGGVSVTFPERLYNMLDVASEQSFDNIVSWQPHGRCFLIHKQYLFITEIMPRFFAQTKFKSFQRQLSLYGFARIKTGYDHGSYFHEYFLAGRPDLIQNIVRTCIKGNGMEAAASSDTEPNFYATPYSYQHHQDRDHINDVAESEQRNDKRDADQMSTSVPLCNIDDDDYMSVVPEPVSSGLVRFVTQPTSFGSSSYQQVVPDRCNDWPEHLFMPPADNRPSNLSFSLESVYLSPTIQQQQDLITRKNEEQESLAQEIQQQQAEVQQCCIEVDGECLCDRVYDDANEFDDTPIPLHQDDKINFLGKKFFFLDLPESLLLQDD